MISDEKYTVNLTKDQFIQFSCSVVSDCLQPHEPQHTRPPCPSPIPRIYPIPCPSSRWCHPTIYPLVVPFSCPQSFPASGSFPVSQIFTSGGQNIGVSASGSALPTNTQDWSPLGWTGWISLQSKGLSRVFSNATIQKHQFFCTQAFFIVQLSHPYMTTGKTIAFTRQTFVGKEMSLFFKMLSRLVITFLPRIKRLLTSWLQSRSCYITQGAQNGPPWWTRGMGWGKGRKAKEGGDIRKIMAHLHYCVAETNTTL